MVFCKARIVGESFVFLLTSIAFVFLCKGEFFISVCLPRLLALCDCVCVCMCAENDNWLEVEPCVRRAKSFGREY